MQGPNGEGNDPEYEYYYEEDEDAQYELRNPEDIKRLIDSLRAGGSGGLAVPPPPPSSLGSTEEDVMVTPPSTDRDATIRCREFRVTQHAFPLACVRGPVVIMSDQPCAPQDC